jgi:hypothetical protein
VRSNPARRNNGIDRNGSGDSPLLRSLYYLLKPYLPWSLRIGLRRIRARRRRTLFAQTWPIDPGSGQSPENWPGWPDGKRFAVVLTHDVEGTKGVERCQNLAKLEKELGFRSSFNFIPEGEYRVSDRLRQHLVDEGFEVGVHDLKHDGKLYVSEAVFSANAERINQYLKQWNAVGFRSGFMHHNLSWISKLDILYDASTFDIDPFEPQPDGFGTIFPFYVGGGAGTGYVELPYTLAQDITMFIILQERTIELWRRKVDWVAEHGGMVLLNLHPDYVSFDGPTGKGEFGAVLYRQLLEYMRSTYASAYWQALPREAAEFVRRNQTGVRQMKVAEPIESALC